MMFDSFSLRRAVPPRERQPPARHMDGTMLIDRSIALCADGADGRAALPRYGATGRAARFLFRRSIRLSTWGSILILIVLAEVFREGARLKEEQELTI